MREKARSKTVIRIQEALSSVRVNAEEVTRLLREARWPVASKRANVNFGSGMTLGLTHDFAVGGSVSAETRRHGELLQNLCCWVRRVCPQFRFTSIQCNHGFAAHTQ